MPSCFDVGFCIYGVEELVEVVTKQLPQAVMRHCFVEYCFLYVCNVCVVACHYYDFTCALVVEPFCSGLLAIEAAAIGYYFYVVKM